MVLMLKIIENCKSAFEKHYNMSLAIVKIPPNFIKMHVDKFYPNSE